MPTSHRQLAIARVIELLEELFPGDWILSGKNVPPDTAQVAMLRREYPFEIRHGDRLRDAVAVLVAEDLLEDGNGLETLEQRVRKAGLRKFCALHSYGVVSIGREGTDILDEGKS